MDPASPVSLIASLWPAAGSKEEISLNDKTRLPKKGALSGFKDRYQKMLTIAQVDLTICQMAAKAIEDKKYKCFDALIKNFGCQMTAFDVYGKLKVKALYEEARQIAVVCQEKLSKIREIFSKPPAGLHDQTLALYCKYIGVDVEVSQGFADLVSFCFLNIIFDLKLEGREEVPVTNLEPLERIKNSVPCRSSGVIFSFDTWVHAIQVKESLKAVSFIQNVANELEISAKRTAVIRKMLSPECVRKAARSDIVAVPQSYSIEAVMRSMVGVFVVKNKLTLCNNPIKTAQRDVVFLRMPEERILSDDEVRSLKPHKPVIVLEGYNRVARPLKDTIREVGVIALLHISTAKMPQYTSMFSQEPLEEDEELDAYAAKPELFRADHMFCSSVGEERDV